MDSQTSPSFSRSVPLLPTYIYGVGLAFLVFFLVRQGWLSHPWFERYLVGHPISLIETGMFCVGAVALGLKAWQLLQERRRLQDWSPLSWDEAQAAAAESETIESVSIAAAHLADPADGGVAVSPGQQRNDGVSNERSAIDDEVSTTAERFLSALRARPAALRQTSLASRMTAILEFIRSRQSVQDVDQQLKHLASQDSDAQYESYSLIRLMVWAIPMLGFLGTVLGISEALGGLNLGADADLSALITSLKSSLYVAFDTTALALTFGVVLMFAQFGLDRVESENLRQVDVLTDSFVHEHFQVAAAQTEQPSRAISRMGQALLKATFSLVEHQHELWNESLVAAQEAWIAATESSAQQSETLLRSAAVQAGEQIATRLAEALGTAEQQLEHRAQQWQVSLSDNTRVLARFQENAATHLQLLEKFFQSSSTMSEQQQAAVGQLIGSIQQLVDQTRDSQAAWQAEQTSRQVVADATNAELERLRAAQLAAAQERQAETAARMSAEMAAREAAERRAKAEAEARVAAEGLASAEWAARRVAEEHARAAEEAKQRAEELARAAMAARKLAERHVSLEAENQRLKAAFNQPSAEPSGVDAVVSPAAKHVTSAPVPPASPASAGVPTVEPAVPPVPAVSAVSDLIPASIASATVSGRVAKAADGLAEESGLSAGEVPELPSVVPFVSLQNSGRSVATAGSEEPAMDAEPWLRLPPIDWPSMPEATVGSAELAVATEAMAAAEVVMPSTGKQKSAGVAVNTQVRSNLLPFPDAKIVRAA